LLPLACAALISSCVLSKDPPALAARVCEGGRQPSQEICEGAVDEDCDGIIDNGCACPGTAGPTMVRLPEGYCIDSTEVTVAQYAAWLATKPSIAAQDQALCGWNGEFSIDAQCMTATGVCQGNGCGNHPQVCIDWCDAQAYCHGAGKRLCGAIGGGSEAFNSIVGSQWYGACSGNGQYAYPTGDTYLEEACNDANHGLWTTVPVGSMPGCQSSNPSYKGVYDLSGNVREWVDSCRLTSQYLDCLTRGGAFDEPDAFDVFDGLQRCDVVTSGSGELGWQWTGFRCCAP
jgi:sulfatase modifying factor 1